MSHAPLRRWIVRRSHFPLALPGEKLGVVEAFDRFAAMTAAIVAYDTAVTVEPEPAAPNPALERVVNRAVKAAGRRERAGAYGRQQRRAKPLNTDTDGDA